MSYKLPLTPHVPRLQVPHDDAGKCTWEYYKMQTDRAISQLDAAERKSLQWAFIAVVGWLGFAVCVPVMLGMMQ